jgi:hypothetical protein
MRVLWTCILALGFAAAPAMARAGDAANNAQPANAGTTAPAANTTATKPDPAAQPAANSEMESELQQLRDLLEAQSKQLQDQQKRMELLEEKLKESNGVSEPATAAAAPGAAATPAIGPATSVVSSTTANGGANAAASQSDTNMPASIHFKGVTLTPMGFFAAETVWRQKGLAADVDTPFNSVPFDGASNAHVSEFQASGRQSRIAMLVEGKLSNVKIGGYYETDFLSAGTTSTPTESNSYTLRQRQFYAQAAFDDGITFTGGQQWSLITETTKGMDNRSEALPLTIDAQYNVGFSWARQYGARITKNFGNKVWLGMSVEESTPTITVHGNPTAQAAATPLCTNAGCTTTTTINTNATTTNFLLGAFGTSGGLENPLGNYGYNEAPDFVVKAVFEPGFGHYEIFGIVGAVHDRVFPCVPITGTAAPAGCTAVTSGANAYNDSATTGGVGGNAKWNLFAKKVDLGIHFLGGAGVGRYGSSTLSDLTVRPNGTVVPIHNFQALGTLVLHPVSKLDIYTYYGGEFEERTDYLKSTAGFGCVQASTGSGICNEGYGYPSLANSGCWTETQSVVAPATNGTVGSVPTGVGGTSGFIPGALGSCTGDTRSIYEATLGFWYRFYNGPRGKFQFGMQYSNILRQTWRGLGGASGSISASGQPHSDDSMVLTSFRYYIP